MEYLLICLTAFLVSGLTLFSGFGLGTVLMPAFALFFPIPIAIAATAVVHLANNVFKLALIGRSADRAAVLRFGLPAALASIGGAGLLAVVSGLPSFWTYSIAGREHAVTVLGIVIGSLIVAFAVLELSPGFAKLEFRREYLALGGLISGFFGGLSGNQGAFRSAFLIKAGLDKEAFVATGVVAAVIVDTVRLAVYGLSYYSSQFSAVRSELLDLVVAATLAAFAGAFAGTRLLRKVTMRAVQLTVAVTLVLVGSAMIVGLV